MSRHCLSGMLACVILGHPSVPSFISESRVLSSLTVIGLGLICGFKCLHVCFMNLSVPVLERISNETGHLELDYWLCLL